MMHYILMRARVRDINDGIKFKRRPDRSEILDRGRTGASSYGTKVTTGWIDI